MRMLIIIITLAVVTACVRKKPDPVEAMEHLVAKFPTEVFFQSGEQNRVRDVSHDVKKTDSLSTPIIGLIDFAVPLYPGKNVAYELVYHWKNEQWVFSSLRCLTRDVNQPVFEEQMLRVPQIASFIRGGEVDSAEVAKGIAEWEAKYKKPITREP